MDFDFNFYTVQLFTSPHDPHYFKSLTNAQNFLWDYYLEHNGQNDNIDVQNEKYKILINLNIIENCGTLYGEWFEDD